MGSAHFAPSPINSEAIILLHGLGRGPFSMWRLARAAHHLGYDVFTPAYPSLKGSLTDHILRLLPLLGQLKEYKKVHAIGHSLGGLILRGLLTRPEASELKLGRLVFLGTPHKGAGLIRQHSWLFNRPQTPAIIHDLASNSAAIQALGIPSCEMACIIGTEKFHPLNPASWLNRWVLGDIPHDGTVEASSAKLAEAKETLEVPVNHSFLPWSKDVKNAAIAFIQNGTFEG